MKKVLLLIGIMTCLSYSYNIYSISAADGEIKSKMDYNSFSIWHNLSADAKVGTLLNARGSLTAVEGTMFTPAVLSGRGNFQIGDNELGIGCKDVNFKITADNTTVDFDFNYNCYINFFDYNLYWWEQYQLLIAEDQIKAYYEAEVQLKEEGYNIARVGWDVGCLLRSGPDYESAPIARVKAGVRLAVGPEIKANKGWLKVKICTDEDGLIDAYIGKKLMTELAGEPLPAFDTTIVIPRGGN